MSHASSVVHILMISTCIILTRRLSPKLQIPSIRCSYLLCHPLSIRRCDTLNLGTFSPPTSRSADSRPQISVSGCQATQTQRPFHLLHLTFRAPHQVVYVSHAHILFGCFFRQCCINLASLPKSAPDFGHPTNGHSVCDLD